MDSQQFNPESQWIKKRTIQTEAAGDETLWLLILKEPTFP